MTIEDRAAYVKNLLINDESIPAFYKNYFYKSTLHVSIWTSLDKTVDIACQTTVQAKRLVRQHGLVGIRLVIL